jgi:hypothetical protein
MADERVQRRTPERSPADHAPAPSRTSECIHLAPRGGKGQGPERAIVNPDQTKDDHQDTKGTKEEQGYSGARQESSTSFLMTLA